MQILVLLSTIVKVLLAECNPVKATAVVPAAVRVMVSICSPLLPTLVNVLPATDIVSTAVP